MLDVSCGPDDICAIAVDNGSHAVCYSNTSPTGCDETNGLTTGRTIINCILHHVKRYNDVTCNSKRYSASDVKD